MIAYESIRYHSLSRISFSRSQVLTDCLKALALEARYLPEGSQATSVIPKCSPVDNSCMLLPGSAASRLLMVSSMVKSRSQNSMSYLTAEPQVAKAMNRPLGAHARVLAVLFSSSPVIGRQGHISSWALLAQNTACQTHASA
jgi:hypothetical protein